MVLAAVTIGMPGSTVWLFADFTTAVPTFINVATLLLLSGTFFKLFEDYKKRYILKEKQREITLFYQELEEESEAQQKEIIESV